MPFKGLRPSSALIPMGGLALSYANKYYKEALYDIYTFLSESKNGSYPLTPSEDLKKPLLSSQNSPSQPDALSINQYSTIMEKYSHWHFEYKKESHPLTAYLCTSNGFFHLSLATCSILQANPPLQPKLSSSVQTEYNALNAKMQSRCSDDDSANLEQVQLLCLLNMILKDISTIINLSSSFSAPIDFPKFIKNLFEKLKGKSQESNISNDDIKEMLRFQNSDSEYIRETILFFNHHCERLNRAHHFFYSNELQDERNNTNQDAISETKLGMIFRKKFGNIVLYLSDQFENDQAQFLSESIMKTGEWRKILAMRYCICAPQT